MPEAAMTTSVNEFDEPAVGVRVFPNPTADYVFVEATEKISRLSIVNTKGQSVKSLATNLSFSNKIELGELSSGVYFLRLQFEGLHLKTIPLVKE